MGLGDPPVTWQQEQIKKRKDKANKKKNADRTGNANPKNTQKLSVSEPAGTLAEALEKQANAQKAQADAAALGNFTGSPMTPSNPIDSMMKDFMSQYNSINVPRTPLEELRKMAEQQAGAQFDPMMNLLGQQITQTSTRANNNMGEARDMYNALGSDFLSQLPELTQQFSAQDKETNNRYDSAQAQLQQMYGDQSKQQNAVLQQLGLAAAAPDAAAMANTDQKYFQGQMETDQQSALNALNQQQMAAQNYQQNLGDTTKVAGENAAGDIRSQLEEYLNSANAQMGGLQAQKSSTMAQLLQQMQAQDADNAAKQEQQQFDNLLAMSRFQLDAANAAAKANGSSADSLFKGTSGLSGAQNFLGQQYGDSPIKASNLMQQLNDVLANKDVVNGKFQLTPGDPALGKAPTYSDVGQEKMMDLLRSEIDKENQASPGRYNTADINNAINALLAYLGKLR